MSSICFDHLSLHVVVINYVRVCLHLDVHLLLFPLLRSLFALPCLLHSYPSFQTKNRRGGCWLCYALCILNRSSGLSSPFLSISHTSVVVLFFLPFTFPITIDCLLPFFTHSSLLITKNNTHTHTLQLHTSSIGGDNEA